MDGKGSGTDWLWWTGRCGSSSGGDGVGSGPLLSGLCSLSWTPVWFWRFRKLLSWWRSRSNGMLTLDFGRRDGLVFVATAETGSVSRANQFATERRQPGRGRRRTRRPAQKRQTGLVQIGRAKDSSDDIHQQTMADLLRSHFP